MPWLRSVTKGALGGAVARAVAFRTPIVEILAQTPEIPWNCQWGLFQRRRNGSPVQKDGLFHGCDVAAAT